MRKTLREKEVCKECGAVKLKPEDIYICDNRVCQKEIRDGDEYKYQTSIHFWDTDNTIDREYCSVECWIEGLKEFAHMNEECQHFISFPHLKIQDLRKLLEKRDENE